MKKVVIIALFIIGLFIVNCSNDSIINNNNNQIEDEQNNNENNDDEIFGDGQNEGEQNGAEQITPSYRMVSMTATSNDPNYSYPGISYNYSHWTDSLHYTREYINEATSGTNHLVYNITEIQNENVFSHLMKTTGYDANDNIFNITLSELINTYYVGNSPDVYIIERQKTITNSIYFATTLYPYYGDIEPFYQETIINYIITSLEPNNGFSRYKGHASDGSYIIYEVIMPGVLNLYNYNVADELIHSLVYEPGEVISGLLNYKSFTRVDSSGTTVGTVKNILISENNVRFDIEQKTGSFMYTFHYVYEIVQ